MIIQTTDVEHLVERTKTANRMKYGNAFLDAHVRALKEQSDKYEWAKVKQLIDSLNEFIT